MLRSRQYLLRRTSCTPRNPLTSSYTLHFSSTNQFFSTSSSPPPSPPSSTPNVLLSEEMSDHIKWIEQKYSLGQDMILMGLPTSLRRRLVTYVAQQNGWNLEYLPITRDTTESDLKQRREIFENTVSYTDQPPVKAALKGHILILDGIENAERNVLPTLNNLLENREMSLDDGRFLTRRLDHFDPKKSNNLAFVHDNFRVIALGLPVPPFSGRSLDPPLRSRFQCRFIDEPTIESLLATIDTSGVDKRKIQSLVNFYEVSGWCTDPTSIFLNFS